MQIVSEGASKEHVASDPVIGPLKAGSHFDDCVSKRSAAQRRRLSLPEAGPRYQLVEGDLYMAPAPNRFHQEISRNLQVKLYLYLREPGLGKIFDAPFDVYLEETNVYQPALVVLLNDRLAILTEEGAEGAPNLVIEILSRKTRRLDLEQKRKAYPRFAVQESWIIDPEPRLPTQYRFAPDGDATSVTISESENLTSPLLPGFTISGSELYER
ncbi:MAG: Uma2 family endonuclease [Verrucomicrobia bacterium]|nr:Uma2 family endonuclease [Verrucomicrobiota bacterium]